MKTCPICKARCFDDMEICYGCMHPFEPNEETGSTPAAEGAVDTRQPSGSDAYSNAGSTGQSHRNSDEAKPLHRKPLRVFGAAGEAEQPWQDEQATSAFGAESYAGCFAGREPASMPMLEPIEGPLAMASLGNGYRLVLAIERE